MITLSNQNSIAVGVSVGTQNMQAIELHEDQAKSRSSRSLCYDHVI